MQPRRVISRHQNARNKVYLFYWGRWLQYLAVLPVAVLAVAFNPIAVLTGAVLAGIPGIIAC